MGDHDWLSIDHKACSPSELVALIAQLDGGEHDALRLVLKRELVDRLKDKGQSERQIIDLLLRCVPSTETRNKITAEWAPVFGLTQKEFKRIVKGN